MVKRRKKKRSKDLIFVALIFILMVMILVGYIYISNSYALIDKIPNKADKQPAATAAVTPATVTSQTTLLNLQLSTSRFSGPPKQTNLK